MLSNWLVVSCNAHSVLLPVCTESVSSAFYCFSCPHWILSDLFHILIWRQCFSASTNYLTYKINLGLTEMEVTAAPEWCVQLQTWPHRVDVKQHHYYSLDSSLCNATVYAFQNSNHPFCSSSFTLHACLQLTGSGCIGIPWLSFGAVKHFRCAMLDHGPSLHNRASLFPQWSSLSIWLVCSSACCSLATSFAVLTALLSMS